MFANILFGCTCLFFVRVAESSNFLNQVYLTEQEMHQIFDNAPLLSTVTETMEEQVPVDEEERVLPQPAETIIYPAASEAVQRNPFVLKFLQANVKVCAGCPHQSNTFRANETDPLPPYDIVICHRESGAGRRMGKFVKVQHRKTRTTMQMYLASVRIIRISKHP